MIIPHKFNIDFNFKSFFILLYFIALLLVNISDSIAMKAFYYFSFLLLCLQPLFSITREKYNLLMFFSIWMIGLCLINRTFVDNLTYVKIFVLIGSFWLAYVISSGNVKTNCFLFIIYFYVIVILCFFVKYGVTTQIFVNCSNNYISVILLAPAVIYYTLLERQQKIIPVFPAFLIWGLSILGGGRGGFLSCSILFLGILFHKFYSRTRKKAFISWLVLFVFALSLPLAVSLFSDLDYSDYRIIRQFEQKGMESDARVQIWSEYTTKSLNNPQNFIFGTELTSVVSAAQYEGNLHNSFLSVHAFSGIIGFIIMLYCLAKGIIYSVKNNYWVYLSCLISFSLRGATDHVFGSGRYTPVFVLLLLYPLLCDSKLFGIVKSSKVVVCNQRNFL